MSKIIINCVICGNPKEFFPSEIKKGCGKTCSKKCRYKYFSQKMKGRKKTKKWKEKIGKANKGKHNHVTSIVVKRKISNSLKGKFTGENRHWCWKGGRGLTPEGYVYVYQPNHPKSSRGRVLEHRIIMEKKLGRYLQSNESVHHKNGIKDDNREENLELVVKTPHHGEIICPHCNLKFLIR